MAEPLGLATHLSEVGLNAVMWSGVAVAGVFVLGRTLLCIFKSKRLSWDDYLIYAAYTVFVANAILQTIQIPHMYYLQRGIAGLEPEDEMFLDNGNIYMRYEFASIGLFWTVLWLVKASFLAVYYKLFEGLKAHRAWWWVVVVFSLLTYAGCWVASILNCHPATNYFHFGQCSKPIDIQGAVIAISYSSTVDVLTDILIMAMPIRVIWKVQISTRQKLGLVGVFSLGLVIVSVAMVRAVQVGGTSTSDIVLLCLWGIIESTVSIIVGCLPPFKTLFSRQTRTNHSRNSKYSNGARSTPQSGLQKAGVPLRPYTSFSVKANARRVRSSDSTEKMMEAGGAGDITVKNEVVRLAPSSRGSVTSKPDFQV